MPATSEEARTNGSGLLRWSSLARARVARAARCGSSALHDLEDRLGLDDHVVLVEQVEALDEQLVAAAFDVQDAEEPAGVAGELAFGRHQLALGGVSADLVARRIVQRLRELLFLRADHVADV